MPERAFALSYFLKVRKLTFLTYCGVCGFAFDADITTMDEYDEAIHFHRNSLCGNFYPEVAEIENEIDEPLFVRTLLCLDHNYLIRTDMPFAADCTPNLLCGMVDCCRSAAVVGYVKVSK